VYFAVGSGGVVATIDIYCLVVLLLLLL